jgi:hypothetical protein
MNLQKTTIPPFHQDKHHLSRQRKIADNYDLQQNCLRRNFYLEDNPGHHPNYCHGKAYVHWGQLV